MKYGLELCTCGTYTAFTVIKVLSALCEAESSGMTDRGRRRATFSECAVRTTVLTQADDHSLPITHEASDSFYIVNSGTVHCFNQPDLIRAVDDR